MDRRDLVVSEVLLKKSPVVYRVNGLSEAEVLGTLYESELQRVALPTEFEIEDILRRKGKERNEQIFVK